jgi:hypothetical protein
MGQHLVVVQQPLLSLRPGEYARQTRPSYAYGDLRRRPIAPPGAGTACPAPRSDGDPWRQLPLAPLGADLSPRHL